MPGRLLCGVCKGIRLMLYFESGNAGHVSPWRVTRCSVSVWQLPAGVREEYASDCRTSYTYATCVLTGRLRVCWFQGGSTVLLFACG